MQTRTKGLAPSPTRSLSKYGDISARVSPTCNLTNLYHYSQRPVYVRFPCNGSAFRRSLRCTSDTYSLHIHRISSLKKGCTEADKARIQSSIAYWMNENQVTKDFLLIQCLPFFINLIEFEKRYKPKGEIITVVKPYDLRYLMLGTSNNCVPPNLRQNPSKLQDSEGFFFRF